MKIKKKRFGFTKTNEEITEFTLINDNECSISIITYGGIITKIQVPDKNGRIENVVLGYNSITEYEEDSPYFGAITGRFAGRISNAQFEVAGETYTLPKNDNGVNTLHGGLKGFDKVIWSATEVVKENEASLVLNYLSEDMEEGFPGNLDTTITYTFNDNNELRINYKATTDKETLLAITNHTYFNLSGDLSTTILDHKLSIPANQFVEIREDSIPMGICDVQGTPFDFRVAKEVGRDINEDHIQLKNGGGYDHPFKLNKTEDKPIILSHELTGRKIEVITDEEFLVFYSGNFLTSDLYLYDNVQIQKRAGLCLETQYCPDNINFDKVPTVTLKPNEIYNHTTTFKFLTL